ncbi:unnamed protein product [Sphagnum balticum]
MWRMQLPALPPTSEDLISLERGTDGQAPTVSIPKRWPLIAQPDNRDQTTLFDARLVNAIAEKSVDGFQVEKRAGLSTTVAYALAGAGEGMFLWTTTALNTILIMISGGTVYGVAPFLGRANLYTIGTGIQGGYFYFCPVEAATPYLVFGAGNLTGGTPTYYITPSSGILQITDSNFPANTVPGIVFLDGTTYVMDPSGGIWGSANLNDPTVWSALNVIYANSEPDFAVFLAKQLVYVIALKAFTVQFFYDAGNTTGSPLAPVPGALLNIGCLSAGSVQVIDDLMFWVSSSKTATPRVVMMRNLQPTIISTPAVERTIAGDIQGATYYSWTFRYGGHRLYGFTSYAANITWVFDIDEQLWYQWTDYLGNYYPIVAFAVNANGQRIAQPLSGGNVYFADADYIYPMIQETYSP